MNTSKNKQEIKAQNNNRLKSAYTTSKKKNYSNKNPKQYNLSNGQNTIDKFFNKKENIYSYENYIMKKNINKKNEKNQNINKNIKVRNMSSNINNRNMNKNINNKITNKNIKIRNMSSNMNNRNMNNDGDNMNKNIYKQNLDKIFIINNKNMNSNRNNFNINRQNIKFNKELLIKKKPDLNEWIRENIKTNPNLKLKEKEKNLQINNRLEIAFKFEVKEQIDDIIELSNGRIGIKMKNKFQIYSLKTLKLITKIDDNDVHDKYIELKNKDLVRKSFSYIQFFKLSGNEYHLFQTIDENNKINSIIKLMNGNLLLSCNDKSINIYGKEDNEYKLLSQKCNEKDCKDAIEIEDNKIVIFKKYNDEDDKRKYLIFYYDILNQNKRILMDDFFSSGELGREYLNMFKNEKYLFVNFIVYSYSYNCYNRVKYDYIYDAHTHREIVRRRHPISLIPPKYLKVGYIFNLEKNNYLKCEYDNFPNKSGEIEACKPIEKKIIDESCIIKSNNNNTMVVREKNSKEFLLESKNNRFILEKFKEEMNYNYFNIVNLENNNFIFYFENKAILIKNN